MSLAQRLKNRLYSFQEDLASSVRGLSSATSAASTVTSSIASYALGTSSTSSETQPTWKSREVDFPENCGDRLLEHYQDKWEEIHLATEKNCLLAERCDKKILEICQMYKRQKSAIDTLCNILDDLPRLNRDIMKLSKTLETLDTSFKDVELALMALEFTIEAKEEQKNEKKARLEAQKIQKKQKAEAEKRAEQQQKEKQEVLQKQFEDDLKAFSSQGLLRVPKKSDPDASLETVDLDEDDSSVLENFLEDVSPLPLDPYGIQGEPTVESNQVFVTQWTSDENEENVQDSGEDLSMPKVKEDSMYFTPSATMENISEHQKSNPEDSGK